MGFKENLRREMEFQDIKQKELSELTGISVNTLRNYINGHNALPNIDSAIKIAAALKVSVEYLATGAEEHDTEENYKQRRKLLADFESLGPNDKKSVLALIAEMKRH
ncbi:helix-turn-helix domain-containing protein [Treponema brennaborense]|uniref:Helix-turn-helix domain protein n=1 Tax=Treponema brennaborense (strain DSM 12168 / CIP 105900 / DD5/3) TaxID=906968 RepID=F4LL24_TREBD|nr:helix-turn-helix transcriptional regulator [Treponema brennaborense]AEE17598.1 helix-turn-helix domain protein [Treponema brennaborense DSM 12168]